MGTMMNGDMIWIMAIIWLLITILLVLDIAALLKYLFRK